jgi:hypothetical protein
VNRKNLFRGLLIWAALPFAVQAQESKFGIGLRGGAGKIEGDVKTRLLKPFASGIIYYSPDPHFSLGLEAGIGDLLIDNDKSSQDSIARVVPIEFDVTLRFSPHHTFSPFATLGAGGVVWHNFRKQDKQTLHYNFAREYSNYIVKTAGGLDIALSRRFNFSLGAAFRYSFTDLLDLNPNGDENDGLITVFSGLTVKIGGGLPDQDRDGVWDRYDLDSRAKEDHDGYMDHDGVPDTQIGSNLLALTGSAGSGVDDIPPIVIHTAIRRATAGSEVKVRAEIFENRSLLKAAVLYRPYTVRRWLVEPMFSKDGETYEARVPGISVQKVGLEYCVVAVDEAISGLGYSGLPGRPNFVRVTGKEGWWRALTILTAAGGWGAAAYVVNRKQELP